MLRYFHFEPSFKLWWCRAHDLCKKFAVQTLLGSLEFVIQINLENDTIALIVLMFSNLIYFVFFDKFPESIDNGHEWVFFCHMASKDHMFQRFCDWLYASKIFIVTHCIVSFNGQFNGLINLSCDFYMNTSL